MISVTLNQNGNPAKVTESGELVVAPLSFDETKFNELAEDDTAYNFYEPKPNKQFVITSMLAYGDKQVGSQTNATVEVYEAASSDSTTVLKCLIKFEIGQNQAIPFTPLRVLVKEGVWVNAKTDDDDIHMTVMGYYINAL